MKAPVGTFNQEKDLLWAFSVIVKPSQRFDASSIDQAYNNGINGLVVHKTDRANVTGNVLWDNGQVPRSEPEARQPYAGLTLNHAEDVEVSCDWSVASGHVTAVLTSDWSSCAADVKQLRGGDPVDSWYKEIKEYKFGVTTPTNVGTGHFSQVMGIKYF